MAWSRSCDTRRRKGEPTGNTNIDLNRRASLRPYRARMSSIDLSVRSTTMPSYEGGMRIFSSTQSLPES